MTLRRFATLLLLPLLLGSHINWAQAEDRTTKDALKARAEQDLLAAILAVHPDAEVSVIWAQTAPIDRPCQPQGLERSGTRLYGRVPYRVYCGGAAPWSYYTQAEVNAKIPVVTNRNALSRGQYVALADLQVTYQDAVAGQRYITRLADAAGKEARRNIPSGSPLQARYLKQPHLIHKGDSVVIQANAGAARISTRGIALQNGHLGDQISVRNAKSERIVQSWVAARGLVTTHP